MRESTNIFRPESPVHPQKLKSSGLLWILLLLFKMRKAIHTSFYLDGTKRIITAIMIREIFQITFMRSEEHTSELQSRGHLVCRLLLEKKNITYTNFRK